MRDEDVWLTIPGDPARPGTITTDWPATLLSNWWLILAAIVAALFMWRRAPNRS